ncbi:MAG TPA: GNAT family protein [Thermoleophilaceae bacterium]|nr:GNAT family protein [Thermoleophilaceae bacterium]
MRVELRPLSTDDRDEFIEAMARSRSFHGTWISPPATPAEFDQLLRRAQDDTFVSLVIRLREDGRLAGMFNISEIVRRAFQSAYVGYGGIAGLEGQGYMTEGMGLVLDYAFGPLGLHRLEANIQPGNTASIALVRRCGFVREGFSERYLKIDGEWRDHERWAIRSELWEELAGAGDLP